MPSGAQARLRPRPGKAIVADGPWFRLPSHQVTLGPAEERLWARILPAMRAAKFEPPRVRDFAKSFGAKDSKGVLLSEVMPDSPAGKAGLQSGDILLEFQGKKMEAPADLQRKVGFGK